MRPIIFFLFLISACTPKPGPDQFYQNMDAIFIKEFDNENGPGGSVLIKKKKETLFLKNYGLADLESKEKISPNTIFNTGSISKTFVSNGILILQERGLLSIEDSLHKYFENFKNEEIAKSIKIKHLLSHTSGLPDLRMVGDNIEFYLTAKDLGNFEPCMQADTLNFQAGEQFQYSNPAYNGLALIIEKVTGEPWQKFVQENIFKPSGMNQSKITNGSYPEDGVAHGYIKNGEEFMEADYGEVPTFAAAGNSGVWSTVLDLVKYEEAIQKNTFLSKELAKASRTLFKPENWKADYPPLIGYSWFLDKDYLFKKETAFELDFVYHTGSQGGFHSFYVLIPEKEIQVVALFNTPLSDRSGIIGEVVHLLEKEAWLD